MRGVVEVDSQVKGSGMSLAERGSDGITSCFVAMKTNLLPSNSLIHVDGGMESIGSKPVFL